MTQPNLPPWGQSGPVPGGAPAWRPGPSPYPGYAPPPATTAPSQQPALVHLEAHQFGAMGLSLTPAKIAVDGVEQSVNIGGNDLWLRPGPHHLETYAVWTFGPFGRATYDTVLQPGQRLDLHWNVPSVAWIKHSTLGPEQGPAPGKGCLIAVYVCLGLVLLTAIIGMIAGLFTL